MTSGTTTLMHLPSLGGINPVRLSTMKAAATRVRDIQHNLVMSGSNVVAEVLRDAPDFYEWDHYPAGDIYDPISHSQFYYHAHAPEDQNSIRTDEHGHFHTFMRPPGFPLEVEQRTDLDGLPAVCPSDGLTHLIAVSINFAGEPVRLFTTNRWVTDETWYPAADVKRILPYFQVTREGPFSQTSAWISNLLMMYGPLIELLMDARDEAVNTHSATQPIQKVWSDQSLEVTSVADISLQRDIDAILATAT